MIRITTLHARYPGKSDGEALRSLDLNARPGRIFALLGSNGAGKTTLLRCLTGLLRPTSGSLQVLGIEIGKGLPTVLRSRMGVLIESPAAYARMTAMEYLRFFAGFYSNENPSARIKELASAFELEALSMRVGKLSQGNRRKIQLMRSLLHQPDVVLWDEPTEHLDPRAQRLALSCLRNHVSAGATALVTSHRLEQMEENADDYGFLKQGSLVHVLPREELNSSINEAEIEGVGSSGAAILEVAGIRFDSVEILHPEKLRAGQWGLRLRTQNILATLPDLMDAMTRGGGRIVRVEPGGRSLENLYCHYVEDTP